MDLNVIFYILSFLLFVIIILQIVIFVNLKNNNQKNLNLADNIKNLETTIIKEENENYVKVIKQLESSQINLINTLNKSLENLRDMNDKKLNEIRHSNEEKLNQIDKNINDRLEISLNDKIDKSFSNIGEQLAKLYKTTGELQNLSVGVTNLQKTLSNVKTRGVFGERQLESILSNMLTSNQYEIQYKLNNEENRIVDFAIKIPEKNGENFIYLPIDSKFPSDYYTKVVRASETGNEELVKSAVKELRTEILNQAKSISEKYIIPPITTDFALMFLPTEGLYSECLRTRTGYIPNASCKRTAWPTAFSNTSTSAARIPRFSSRAATRSAAKWASNSPRNARSMPTSSFRYPTAPPPQPSATPRPAASVSKSGSSVTTMWAEPSLTPRRTCANRRSSSSSTPSKGCSRTSASAWSKILSSAARHSKFCRECYVTRAHSKCISASHRLLSHTRVSSAWIFRARANSPQVR